MTLLWKHIGLIAVLGGLVALDPFVGGAGQAKAEYIFTTLDMPGATFTTVAGINNLGQIVGNSSAGSFLLSGGNFTALNLRAPPSGINDSGQIVGGDFIYSGGNYTTLHAGGAFDYTTASGINNAGQVVGFTYNVRSGQAYDPNTGPGYLLTGSGYTTFGMYTTIGRGINDSSQIVGYSYMYPNGMHHAFLLSGDNYTTFDVPGATTTEAYGINNSGEIVGTYVDAGGIQHGFLAAFAPVPEPSALLLLGIGTLGVIGWTWRRR